MIPCYNPTQLSEENVAICVSFAPLKTISNSDGYFSGYTIFYHDKYRNKHFREINIFVVGSNGLKGI